MLRLQYQFPCLHSLRLLALSLYKGFGVYLNSHKTVDRIHLPPEPLHHKHDQNLLTGLSYWQLLTWISPLITYVWLRALLLTSQLTSNAVWTSIGDVAFSLAIKTVQFLKAASLCAMTPSTPKTRRLVLHASSIHTSRSIGCSIPLWSYLVDHIRLLRFLKHHHIFDSNFHRGCNLICLRKY